MADLYTVIAVLFLLIVVPIIFVGIIAVVSGYLRHDAEEYLAELNEEEEEPSGPRDSG